MRFSLHKPWSFAVLILLVGMLTGVAIDVAIGHSTFVGAIRWSAFATDWFIVSIGAGAFLMIGRVFLKSTAGRRDRLDRDLLDAFLEHIPDNVFFKDRESRFLRISRAMADRFGLKSPASAVGRTDADFFSTEHANQALADEREVIRTGQSMIEKEEKETWPDGHETWVLTTKVPFKNHEGKIIGTMGIAHDITDRKQAELQVKHMALHDSLTGLPNRVLLEDRMAQAIAAARRNESRVAILLLDLDCFKQVNDSFGHVVGDRLLELVSDRLRTRLRESDTIARLAGDQFVIVCTVAEGLEAIERVANKVLDTLSTPFTIENQDLPISASIGISQFPSDAKNPAELLRFADIAVYEAKEKGRGQYRFFSPAFTEAAHRRHKLESDLLQACARDEFVVYYQPIVATSSGRITGVEALLRWRHPEQGLLPPSHFLSQLEDMGQIAEVGRWILKTACCQAADWQMSGFPPIRVAVNISAQQFYHGSILDSVASVLQETKLDPRLLELELTESRSLDPSEATVNIMRSLKRLGVSLSLDDFGTGWSSLSYLRRFPIDRIKIDRSFVRDVISQRAAEEVVKSILSLSHNLGIACIAEGVETREEQDYFKRQNCAEMQGFLFSRPLTAVDATALLRSANVRPQPARIKSDSGMTPVDA
jgi:diguanylate cyclase (GGDEF)-like protein/PAS domain S-box-containing protein